jgi:hypothetical protein
MSDFGFYSGPAKSFDDSTEEDSDMESVFSEVSPIAVANGGTEETKNEVGLDDSDIWGDDEDGVVGAEEQEAKRKLKVEEMSSAMLIELSGTPDETEDAGAVAYVDDQEMKKARKRLQQIEKVKAAAEKKDAATLAKEAKDTLLGPSGGRGARGGKKSEVSKRSAVEIRQVETAAERQRQKKVYVQSVTSDLSSSSSSSSSLSKDTPSLSSFTQAGSSSSLSSGDSGMTITIKTRLNSKHEMTWDVQPNKMFHGMIANFAQVYGVAAAEVKFKFDGEFLGSSSTPNDIDMEEGDLVDVYIPPTLYDAAVATAKCGATAIATAASGGEEGGGAAAGEDISGAVRIFIKTRLNGKHVWTWEMQPSTAFGDVMDKFAQIYGVNTRTAKFQFDGEVLNRTATPEDLEMEKGDLIDVTIASAAYAAAESCAEMFKSNPDRTSTPPPLRKRPSASRSTTSASSSSATGAVLMLDFAVHPAAPAPPLALKIKVTADMTVDTALNSIVGQAHVTSALSAWNVFHKNIFEGWVCLWRGQLVDPPTTIGTMERCDGESVHILPIFKATPTVVAPLLLYHKDKPNESKTVLLDMKKSTLSNILTNAAQVLGAPKKNVYISHSTGGEVKIGTKLLSRPGFFTEPILLVTNRI